MQCSLLLSELEHLGFAVFTSGGWPYQLNVNSVLIPGCHHHAPRVNQWRQSMAFEGDTLSLRGARASDGIRLI